MLIVDVTGKAFSQQSAISEVLRESKVKQIF